MRKGGCSAANKGAEGFEDNATNKQPSEVHAEKQVQLYTLDTIFLRVL